MDKKLKSAIEEPLLTAEDAKDTNNAAFKVVKGFLGNVKKQKKNITFNPEEDDPLRVLGYGIVAYRDMVWSMTIWFCLFSILALPAIYIYS